MPWRSFSTYSGDTGSYHGPYLHNQLHPALQNGMGFTLLGHGLQKCSDINYIPCLSCNQDSASPGKAAWPKILLAQSSKISLVNLRQKVLPLQRECGYLTRRQEVFNY